MYNYENSVTGNVKAEQVWELYSTVARWSRWDIEVESVSLEGSFVTEIGRASCRERVYVLV